jgi:hypothetical protein
MTHLALRFKRSRYLIRRLSAVVSGWIILLLTPDALVAGSYYKCTAPDGSLSYQSEPCPDGHDSKVLEQASKTPVEREIENAKREILRDYKRSLFLEERRQAERDRHFQQLRDEQDAMREASEADQRAQNCEHATRMFGVYGNGADWRHMTREQREDPDILYYKNEMEQSCL